MSDSMIEIEIETPSARQRFEVTRALVEALSSVNLPPSIATSYIGESPTETRGIPTGPAETGVVYALTVKILDAVWDDVIDRLVSAIIDQLRSVWRHSDNPTIKVPILDSKGNVIRMVKLDPRD
jgi:hypothetical protein